MRKNRNLAPFTVDEDVCLWRGSGINGDWSPTQRVPVFFIRESRFGSFWVILKNLTDFLETVETSVDPRQNLIHFCVLFYLAFHKYYIIILCKKLAYFFRQYQ